MSGKERISLLRRWTNTAVECFKRGCVCKGCFYEGFFKAPKKCQMKAYVICLVRKHGKPEGVVMPTILEEEPNKGYSNDGK